MSMRAHCNLSEMCGRYGRFSRKERIEQALERSIEGGEALAPRYNVCPGLPDWVMRQAPGSSSYRMDKLHWGLLPSWTKQAKSSRRPINARAETVAGKPMFRELLRRRRCAVPIDGYYEWRSTPSGKTPYWFRMKSAAPFFLAGLWDCWHEGQPDAVASYILMTIEPNALAAKVHHRMPVLLDARDVARWLDPGLTEASDLLRTYPAHGMASHPVSRRVSDPDAEGPALIEPASEAQGSFFD
jgi:putative SOS response-associated peptidase YedK